MSTNPMEILLSQLFASPNEVEQFLQDRLTYAKKFALTATQITEILEIDGASLRFATNSYERKRRSRY